MSNPKSNCVIAKRFSLISTAKSFILNDTLVVYLSMDGRNKKRIINNDKWHSHIQEIDSNNYNGMEKKAKL